MADKMEISVTQVNGSVAPNRWQVKLDGVQVGYVEEVILSRIYGKREYIGFFFDGTDVALLRETYTGQDSHSRVVAAVVEGYSKALQSRDVFQRDAD
jgi:hypothetical protein